jgi:hypothetical protein
VNRRAFVTGLGAVLAVPLAAEAQPAAKASRLGIFSTGNPRCSVLQYHGKNTVRTAERSVRRRIPSHLTMTDQIADHFAQRKIVSTDEF